MKWYAVKYKSGLIEVFRAEVTDFNNGMFLTFINVILSDCVAEYYHIAKSEILSIASDMSGDIVDEAKKDIGI